MTMTARRTCGKNR